jgi:hypothetical protein
VTNIRLFNRLAIVAIVFCLLPQIQARPQAQRQTLATADAEQGKFRLHKFEQPIGEETYTISPGDGSETVEMKFEFTDRGQHVPLKASLRAAPDWTPQLFEISGSTSRISTVDEAVEVQPAKIRLRMGKEWTEAARPPAFFTIEGSATGNLTALLQAFPRSLMVPCKSPAGARMRSHPMVGRQS